MSLSPLRLDVGRYSFDGLVSGPADAPLVLFLHGWPQFADCWTPILAGVSQAGYRAVAVDQRG